MNQIAESVSSGGEISKNRIKYLITNKVILWDYYSIDVKIENSTKFTRTKAR